MPVKIVIADGHATVRRSLRLLIAGEPDMELLGEATDGLEALQTVRALQPDLLLMDIKMRRMSGLKVLQYLRSEKHPVAVVFFSSSSETPYVDAAMRLGADAFVAKASGLDVLLAAIHAVRDGKRPIDPNTPL
ncbi:MAG: LuxR family transcriptional regulator [Chthonomonadaceae bacterium]|nr:LuxR family transcriptional regulator [Chthonomonadaceae bacterium]